MSRRRDRKGLQVARGARYALIPREALESEAYRALPPWAVLVLLALAVQYYTGRGGHLALPWSEARGLGVRTQAHLYGGLQILEAVELIQCTRRGHLAGGRQLSTLYALTWHPVNDAPAGVTYDAGISVTLQPSNAWARWTRPEDWDEHVLRIARRAKGKRNHVCPFESGKKIAVSPRGETAAHPVGSEDGESRSPRGEWTHPNPTHPVGETSEISGLGVRAAAEPGA